MKSRRHACGLTLVELLVSISIGLVVIGALVALYVSTARSYRQLDALGQLQSNARYVFEIMGYDIRMAGNMTCQVPGQTNAANFISSYRNNWWSDTAQPLFGQDETDDSNAKGDSNFKPDYKDNALRGDTLIVLRANADETIGEVGSYDLGDGAISFSDPTNAGFKNGRLLLLTDCLKQAAVFQKSGPADPSDMSPIGHNKNCKANLQGSNPNPDPAPGSCPPDDTTRDMTGAKLLPLSANAYYLRESPYKYPNSNQNIPSLFRQTLTTSGNAPATTAEELISGVTDLQILYGVDTSISPTGVIGSYMTASQINAADTKWWSDPKRVLAVRVTVTLESQDDNVIAESRSFTLGNGTVITDRRLRRSYTMTFGLRKRLS